MRQELLYKPGVVSYSFRSKQNERQYRDGNFILNFPIHMWLYALSISQVLSKLILFEYWLPEERNIEVLPAFSLDQINNPFLTNYPLSDEKRGLLFKKSVTEDSDEKQQQYTRLMVEASPYLGEEHHTIISKMLSLTLVMLPKVLISIVADYIEKKTFTDVVLDELNLFIKNYANMNTDRQVIINYRVILFAVKAIQKIREGEGFQTLSLEDSTQFASRPSKNLPAFPGYPIKHYFEFLHKFFYDRSFSSSTYKIYDMTFLEHITQHTQHMEPVEIQNIPRVFCMARSLIESAYILSTETFSSTIFYFSSEVVGSLCRHIVQDLQRGGDIKNLNNRGTRPVLLNKITDIIQNPLTSIEFNGPKGFLGTFTNKGRGIQFLNYHKRSKILSILYKYINDTKSRFAVSSFFSSEENYSKQAKDLADRLLNIPFGSPKEFLIVDEIQTLLSQELKSEPYKKALMQVVNQLLQEERGSAVLQTNVSRFG